MKKSFQPTIDLSETEETHRRESAENNVNQLESNHAVVDERGRRIFIVQFDPEKFEAIDRSARRHKIGVSSLINIWIDEHLAAEAAIEAAAKLFTPAGMEDRHPSIMDYQYPSDAEGDLPAFNNIEEEAAYWDNLGAEETDDPSSPEFDEDDDASAQRNG